MHSCRTAAATEDDRVQYQTDPDIDEHQQHINQIENISEHSNSSLGINKNDNHQDNNKNSEYKHFIDPVTEIGGFVPHSCDELRTALDNVHSNDETSIQVDDELQSEMFSNSTTQVGEGKIEQEPYP